MSSAGDKSIAIEGGALVLSGTVLLEEEWREIVKENSWEGEEDAEGGEAGDIDDGCLSAEASSCCFLSTTFPLAFCC